jgi:colanic acid biosynthesis protein WcaH
MEMAPSQALRLILESVPNARTGLPLDIFQLVSRLTPLVNVDLLLQRHLSANRSSVLLTWRDDDYYKGWHVPGGIIRFKETWNDRLDAVALTELGTQVSPQRTLLGVFEMMASDRDIRGHFISLLFQYHLTAPLNANLECKDATAPNHGEWSWFDKPPHDLLHQQRVYVPYLNTGRT